MNKDSLGSKMKKKLMTKVSITLINFFPFKPKDYNYVNAFRKLKC